MPKVIEVNTKQTVSYLYQQGWSIRRISRELKLHRATVSKYVKCTSDSNYKGYVHADAYSGYDKLFEKEEIAECACWMHVLRKFYEAEDGPVELRETILKLIQNRYRYERVLSKTKSEQRLKYRQIKISPIVEEIFNKARNALTDNKTVILPRSKIRQAISYLFNQQQALKTFLTDPYVKPDNGTSERAIRPLAIGRKNWLRVLRRRFHDELAA